MIRAVYDEFQSPMVQVSNLIHRLKMLNGIEAELLMVGENEKTLISKFYADSAGKNNGVDLQEFIEGKILGLEIIETLGESDFYVL